MKNKLLSFLMVLAASVWSLGTWAAVTDVTSTYLTNANFAASTGWTTAQSGTSGATFSNNCLEFWGSSAGSLYIQAYQTLSSLPSGIYRFTLNGFNRAASTLTNVYVYANTTDKEYDVSMKTLASETSSYGSTPNSMSAASTAFYSTAGDYWLNTVDNILVTDGNLKIGFRNVSQLTVSSGCWTIVGNAKLYQLTGSDLSSYLSSTIATATTLVAKNYTGASTLQAAIDVASAIAADDIVYTDITTLQAAIKTYETASLNTTDATTATPVDATFMITNAGFEDGSDLVVNTANGGYNQPKGWTLTYGATHTNNHFVVANNTTSHAGYSTVITPSEGSYSLGARMRWSTGSNQQITQTVSGLTAGSYKLSVDLGFGGTGTNTFTGVIGSNTVFTASATATTFTTFTSDYFTVADGNSLVLTYKLAQSGSVNTYSIVDNIKLTYYGDPIAALLLSISTAKNSLEGYSSTIPSGVYATFADHISAAGSATSSNTQSELQTILDNLNSDITTASALVTPYATLQSLITTCTSIQNNSTPDDGLAVDGGGTLNTLATAITAATTSLNEATATSTTLGTAYSTLEAARQVYVVVADPASGYPFDYTFKVTNPTFDSAITGWTTTTKAQNNALASNKTGDFTGKFWENWNGSAFTGKMYQTITGLPSGVYSVKAAAFSNAGGVYLYANSGTKVAINAAGTPTYATATGNVSDGSLEIGLTSGDDAATSNWWGLDNVTLSFSGFDQTAALASLNTLITDAGTYTSKQMQSSVLTALNEAITAANTEYNAATHTKNSIQTANSNLTTARDNASASATHYASLLAAITKVSATTAATALATDIATAQGVYDGKTATSDGADAAATALQTALESYASTVENSSAIDLTSYYLVNGDFSDGTNGWTKTGSITASHTWSVASNVLTFAPASGWYTGCTTWQTVTLPAGSYKLSADVNAQEISGHATTLFAATSAPAWNNVLSGVLASKDVTTYGSYETLSTIFTLTAQTSVILGVNATANNANGGVYGSYSVKNFKLEQAKNEIETVNGTTTATGTWTAAEIAAIPVTTDIKALDLKAVTIPASTTVTVTSNPNCLIYAADATNLTNSNVIVSGTCASFILNEGYDFASTAAFTATAAAYNNRTLYTDGGWQTFYAPIKTAVQDGYIYETFNKTGTASGSTYASFTDVTSTVTTAGYLDAYTPYLMKKSTAEGTSTTVNIAGEASQSVAVEGTQSIEFRGTSSKITITDANKGNYYVMNGDGSQFQKAGTGAIIPAYRAYLYLTSGPSSIRIHHDDATGINPAVVDVNAAANVYSVDGRLLRSNVKAGEATTGLSKGIYVVNGKKVVVK